ncbi:MAG: hypothetical protein V1905_03860 [bacterium]
MNLNDFLVRNQLNISEAAGRICEQGIEMMRDSIDILHNSNHVYRMFGDLEHFIRDQPHIRKEINLDVLLMSIVWHDVWRTSRFPFTVRSLLIDRLWEGIGSGGLFTRMARNSGLNQNTIKAVSYNIRKHAGVQFWPAKTIESQVLKDLDQLDEWSFERVKPLREKYPNIGVVDFRLVKLAQFYFDHFLIKKNITKFYFQWSQQEFINRREVFLNEINRLIAEYTSNI